MLSEDQLNSYSNFADEVESHNSSKAMKQMTAQVVKALIAEVKRLQTEVNCLAWVDGPLETPPYIERAMENYPDLNWGLHAIWPKEAI